MTTMAQKVALVIIETANTPFPMSEYDALYLARAVIEAMMEPTSKMLDAAADEEDRRGYFSHENLIAEEVWPIMIQAALKEGQ